MEELKNTLLGKLNLHSYLLSYWIVIITKRKEAPKVDKITRGKMYKITFVTNREWVKKFSKWQTHRKIAIKIIVKTFGLSEAFANVMKKQCSYDCWLNFGIVTGTCRYDNDILCSWWREFWDGCIQNLLDTATVSFCVKFYFGNP